MNLLLVSYTKMCMLYVVDETEADKDEMKNRTHLKDLPAPHANPFPVERIVNSMLCLPCSKELSRCVYVIQLSMVVNFPSHFSSLVQVI